jgi:hypothetical protein
MTQEEYMEAIALHRQGWTLPHECSRCFCARINLFHKSAAPRGLRNLLAAAKWTFSCDELLEDLTILGIPNRDT